MSCPLHSYDNSCAGCAKIKIKDLERQLAEAREEVDYAIEFFNKNEYFGVAGILKGIRDKLKEPKK